MDATSNDIGGVLQSIGLTPGEAYTGPWLLRLVEAFQLTANTCISGAAAGTVSDGDPEAIPVLRQALLTRFGDSAWRDSARKIQD